MRANRLPNGGLPVSIPWMAEGLWEDLELHLARSTSLPAPVARRVVLEVVDYFSESPETFVRRRHRELQAAGGANNEIFPLVAAELAARRVPGPQLTERQIRRLIYG